MGQNISTGKTATYIKVLADLQMHWRSKLNRSMRLIKLPMIRRPFKFNLSASSGVSPLCQFNHRPRCKRERVLSRSVVVNLPS